MVSRLTHEPEIDFSTFPETDGKPMAETEVNLEQMIRLILEFRQAVAPRGHHVGGNLLVYYNPEDGHDHISPDVFVALDAGPAFRESWKVWLEGKFPEVVFEVASPSTQRTDIRDKVRLYERLGAVEYYIYDPAGRLQPAFRGYTRQQGRLVLMANPTGVSITSPRLDLELRVVDGWLRVIDPVTGYPYPSPEEEHRLRLAADLHAWEEARLRQEAEDALLAAGDALLAAEDARLAAEDARLAAEDARLAAERARQEAEEARRTAEGQAIREAQARRAAEEQAARELLGRQDAETARREAEVARQVAETHTAQLEAALQAALAELARLRAPDQA
jgi:Uma2 family endonuclease